MGGGFLPEETGNRVQSYVLKRKFKNMIKTTNMNGHFEKYEGTESGIHDVGHYAWDQQESGDYIVPYLHDDVGDSTEMGKQRLVTQHHTE